MSTDASPRSPDGTAVTSLRVTASASAGRRISSLDQFRGYTVAGMFLVNFVGGYTVIKEALPNLLHHHTFCSYADTIMPQFFLAVGFGYRMTFLRRREREGIWPAYRHVLWRVAGLLVIALFVHGLDGDFDSWQEVVELGPRGFVETAFQRSYFQTLTHIAVTTLWVLPVIAAGWWPRVAFMAASGVLFHLLSQASYYDWVLKRPGIDGGPLGFLTWTIPLLAGTLAYDLWQASERPPVTKLLLYGAALAALGYALASLNTITPPNSLASGQWPLVEPPFVRPSQPVNIWTMSQRAGSVSYLTFGAGFSLLTLALFVLVSDVAGWQLPLFRTLGTNALVAYVLHDLVMSAMGPFIPRDAPLWYLAAAFVLFFAVCYACLRYLEANRLYLKL
ncbi:MAG: heparan-alpha-glucosaminide N-acetyltransferase domain-containing protein [Pirellulaceae bacterium]|nr:heparan-alpha-glucosaminide N-acetyltransferase domain-containing protein [Pirellulaceae bacterium]